MDSQMLRHIAIRTEGFIHLAQTQLGYWAI